MTGPARWRDKVNLAQGGLHREADAGVPSLEQGEWLPQMIERKEVYRFAIYLNKSQHHQTPVKRARFATYVGGFNII